MPPLVSVIIPAYNSAATLGEAIESALAQDVDGVEVIVVDDGSSDDTPRVMAAFDGRIIAIRQPNGGPSKARNTGIARAGGRYLAFLDADDVFLPGKLSLQCAFLEAHPQLDLVYSDGTRFREEGDHTVARALSYTGDLFIVRGTPTAYRQALMIRNLFPIHCAVVRRASVERVGGFDECLSACEDWDLWARITEGGSMAYLDGTVAAYRVTPGSNSTDLPRNYAMMSRIYEKIGQAADFASAPAAVRRDYAYQRGLIELSLGMTRDARAHLRQAAWAAPLRWDALTATILTALFGARAYAFYDLKRQWFGKRGMRRL